jgi:hypothetical protein
MRITQHPLPLAALSLIGAAVILAACSDRAQPLLRTVPDTPVRQVAAQAYLRCTADVAAGSVACREVSPGTGGGGVRAAHYIYVEGAPHALMPINDYVATSTDVSFDLRVVNLVPQAIGTDDGVTLHSRGVRVFFFSNPSVTSGTGSVSIIEPGTTGTFTRSNQAYHQFNEIIPSQDTSVAEKHFRFGITGTVNSFDFLLGVSTNMQWAAITSASSTAETVAVSDSVDLDAWRLNSLGDTMAISSITWASSAPGVATVGSASGVVHGVGAGTANVVASQSGSRPDTVAITVN